MKTEITNRWLKYSEIELQSLLNQISTKKQIGLLDFRGIPIGNKNIRNNIENKIFEFIDFSSANFENCNFTNLKFKDCKFKETNFKELRMWNCDFENCKFIKSNFTNATLGVNSRFKNCEFEQSQLTGKYFDFGKQNIFEKCNFIKCKIHSAWIISVKFEYCIFESLFKDIRFSGKQESEILNKSEQDNFPTTFNYCNLYNSIFEDVEFMDGVILNETHLPNQKSERFNNDRIYYSTNH